MPKSSSIAKEPPPVSLQERKQRFVRDAIWDAAIDLFDRKGFDETTVEEIAQAVVSYGTALTDAIESCPAGYSLGEVFRSTVLRVAQDSVSYPRTRKVMEITEKYPAAREAQIARVAEVQDRVAEAFARRCRKTNQGELEAQVLAGLTLSMLSVAFFSWFRRGTHDIAVTVEQVFTTLSDVAGESRKRR